MARITTDPAKPTKAELIALLVKQDKGRPEALKRLTLAGLQAMVAEASEQPEKTEEPVAADTPSPLAGDLVLAAEDAQAGDVYCGIAVLEVQAATKWVYFRSEAGWFFQVFRGTPVHVTRAA